MSPVSVVQSVVIEQAEPVHELDEVAPAGLAVAAAFAGLVEALDGDDPPCRRLDAEWWFPAVGDDAEDVASVVRVCERECPAPAECLAYARSVGAEVGVWGGVLLGRVRRDEGGVAA